LCRLRTERIWLGRWSGFAEGPGIWFEGDGLRYQEGERIINRMNTFPSPRAAIAILIVTTLSAFVTPFMGAAINIALPAIGAELRLSAVTLTWVNTSYMLTTATLLLPFGRMADLYGRRRFFIFGTWMFTLFSILGALAPSGAWLLAARVFQGAGGAMVFANSAAILTSVFPSHQRGRVLGVNVTGVYLGLTLGPVLGGLLIHAFGWRSILWLNLPLGILIAFLAYRYLPHDARRTPQRMDMPGALLFIVALGSLIIGLSRAAGSGGRVLVLVSVALFVLWVLWERRARDPMLDLRLFMGNRVFLFSNLAALINYSSTFAVVFLLSLYLQYIKGMTASAAGGVLLIQPLVMALLAGAAGAMSDRIAPRILASTGMAVTAVGLVFLARLDVSTPNAHVMAVLAILGIGAGLFSSPNTNAIMGSVEARHLGVATAAMGTMRMSGQVLSMGFAALVLSLVMGPHPVTPENHASLLFSQRLLAALFAVLCLSGVFISLARGKVGNR
jgi:EmrB/QacA subfamily drug resistance transporter